MQDKAIIEIGKLKGGSSAKPYQNFIGNLFPGKNYNIVLAVFNFTKSENGYTCVYEEIDYESASQKNYLKFAYRKGSARGGDITFTTKFGDIDKKFKTFYPKQVKDVIAFAKNTDELEEVEIFMALENCLEKAGEAIKSRLQEKYESLDKPSQLTTGFSVKFNGLEGKEYLEDFSTIQKLLYKKGTVGKSEKYKVVSEGHNEICSICLDNKPTLHGFASPFKYSTVDKTGMVSGFFKQKNNWKNYPICSDCALDFELGQKWVRQHLSKYFYGKNYYIIPKVVIGSNPKLLKKALSVLQDIDYKEKEGVQIRTNEDYLMRKIGKEEGSNNQFALSLLFFEENPTTKAIKIKMLLEEILPSRFQTLFIDVPKIIDSRVLFKEAISINKERRNLNFTFGILRHFFGDNFYDITQKVFLGLPISEEVLFSKLMNKIRKVFINTGLDSISKYSNSYYTYYLTSETKGHTSLLKLSLMVLDYFRLLKMIPSNQNIKSMEISETENLSANEKKKTFDEEKFKLFLSENTGFLSTPEKIGIFSIGIYVRFLIDIQNVELKNTPFEKKLRGYNLNPTILENIYVEAYKKISQYKTFYTYSNLREIIKKYFILNKHKLNQISNSELSFYFVAGLEFGNQFKTKNKNSDNE